MKTKNKIEFNFGPKPILVKIPQDPIMDTQFTNLTLEDEPCAKKPPIIIKANVHKYVKKVIELPLPKSFMSINCGDDTAGSTFLSNSGLNSTKSAYPLSCKNSDSNKSFNFSNPNLCFNKRKTSIPHANFKERVYKPNYKVVENNKPGVIVINFKNVKPHEDLLINEKLNKTERKRSITLNKYIKI